MKLFVKAVVTGFAWSLGAALFKKVQARLGLDDASATAQAKPSTIPPQDGSVVDSVDPSVSDFH